MASEIMVFLGILLSFHIFVPYSVPQYVISGLIMFVSAEVLEGKIYYLITYIMLMIYIESAFLVVSDRFSSLRKFVYLIIFT